MQLCLIIIFVNALNSVISTNPIDQTLYSKKFEIEIQLITVCQVTDFSIHFHIILSEI